MPGVVVAPWSVYRVDAVAIVKGACSDSFHFHQDCSGAPWIFQFEFDDGWLAGDSVHCDNARSKASACVNIIYFQKDRGREV